MKKNFIIFLLFVFIFTACGDDKTTEIIENQVISFEEVIDTKDTEKNIELDTEEKENNDVGLPKEGKSNNRDYDWFIDQGKTGKASSNNCGPSSAVMVHKWYDESTEMTAEKAREEFPENWGWWSTTTIEAYFKANDIPYEEKLYKKPEDLKKEIDSGKVGILCIDSTYITYDPFSKYKTGRFYEYTGGHFIVVKGYQYLNDQLYWEVYDPNNHGLAYQDGKPMGKDRLYSESDVDTALKKWWNFILYVDPKSSEK